MPAIRLTQMARLVRAICVKRPATVRPTLASKPPARPSTVHLRLTRSPSTVRLKLHPFALSVSPKG